MNRKIQQGKCLAVGLMLLTSICALITPAANGKHAFQTPLDDSVPMDAAVATPQSVLGFEIGRKAVRYEALVQYLYKLAETSSRVSLAQYGTTHEGRILYYLTITSQANQNRLDEIKTISAKLADPRKITESDNIEMYLDSLPAVAWLAYNIHGDELSSTDAAVYVAYRLAAGKDSQTADLLNNIVIHIDPLQNPDGRERFLSQIEQLSGIVENSDYQAMQHAGLWSRGRGNHYLFDLNRDWLTMVHPETKGRAAVILAWNPHLLVDSHEMGPMETYLFDPPNDPVNMHLAPTNMSWRRRFSQDHAAAFNGFGWSYYTGEWYSDWGPFYTNAWANLLGATGILYEQARANAAIVKQPTGQVMTFAETVHHHVVSTFANLRTLAANRRAILADFLADRTWAVSGDGDTCKGTFLLPPADNQTLRQRLIDVIKAHGIELAFAAEPLKAHGATDIWGKRTETIELPAGTAIVRSAQPHRRLLHTLLEFDPRLDDKTLDYERSELENRRATHLYDVSSWSLALACGLHAYWADDLQPVNISGATSHNVQTPAAIRTAAYGYIIDFADSSAYPVLARLFANNCRPRIATRRFTADRRSFPAGAIVLRKHENPDNLGTLIAEIAKEHPGAVIPVDTALVTEGPDLGGPRIKLLHEPRVAIASQWPVSSTSFGSVWHLLDHNVRLRTSPINIQNINWIDLRKYNVLILPAAGNLASVLDAAQLNHIRRWVEGGGTLIALGASAAFVADAKSGLSAVRLRRDVL